MNTAKLLCILTAIVAFISITSRAMCESFGSGINTFGIEFVPIGSPNNPADTTGSPNPVGSVSYAYRIGKYEISRDMINKANALGSLGVTLDTSGFGGVGINEPATGISWNEAARFINWLNTSQGVSPAYKFFYQPGEPNYDSNQFIQSWEVGDAGYDPNNPYRNSLARYFLPSANEWYKAAYFDPVNNSYYQYPTGSNSEPDGIDFVGDTNFEVVYRDQSFNPAPNDITNAGLLSPYGTMAQGGNAWEWNETDTDLVNDFGDRIVRGGNWDNFSPYLSSTNFLSQSAAVQAYSFGFRVASVIPEPTTAVLAAFAAVTFSCLCRRHK
jgi:hypothetical protein